MESATTPARLILVDGSGYIFRAYHALPPLTRADGTPVGAVYGFTTMLLKLREQMPATHFAVIFDAARVTFRQEIYAEYKAHRPPAPEDLVPQFPLVREATEALGVPAIEMAQFEADDLIAAYAKAGRERGMEVVIVSSDKDLMQLIRPGVSLYDPMKNKPIGPAEVLEKFGVAPEKVVEVQALIGDPTDNVPGVPGIGPKTAAELISAYGDLEGVLSNLEHITQPKRRQALTEHAEAARLSHRLVTLCDDMPLPLPLDALTVRDPARETMLAFMTAQRFTSLVKRYGGDTATSSPRSGEDGRGALSGTLSQARIPANLPSPGEGTQILRTPASLSEWLARAVYQGSVGFRACWDDPHAMRARLIGFALVLASGEACYVPLAHMAQGQAEAGQGSLFGGGEMTRVPAPGQMQAPEALRLLGAAFAKPELLVIGHNLKHDMLALRKYNLTIASPADAMLLSYCTSAGLHGHGLAELSALHLGHQLPEEKALLGSGKQRTGWADLEIEMAASVWGAEADTVLRLYHHLLPQLIVQHTVGVYEECERALVPVLVAMEARGITVSRMALEALSQEFRAETDRLEKEIHALAGYEFAVGSPKQLGEVLFERMGIAGGKKSSKSGAYTTDAETLEALSASGHTIADKVLEWRHLSKLQSTYTDALPRQINAETGRVHTSYSMSAAATGRLSSVEPNLQNIPIRTPAGKRIRTAFVAAAGCKLISADYSQIELRLLAHIAGIDALKQAFAEGRDIHTATASHIFGVALDQVDGDLRRKAKTINFGIIYGMSAHGLAVRLGITRPEAAGYIEAYFARYPGIREYMDRTIAFAREHGYVTTLFGRRVYVKDIQAKQPALRAFSERAAINAPLQGTAADVMKRAMVDVFQGLRVRFPEAQILLQVHDELVIESPEAIAVEVAAFTRKTMQQAARFSVPLTVEAGVGDNWGEIH